MKVLTVRQPWAGLIFCGKDIENRTWKTAYRGPLLIHASATADPWPALPVRVLRGSSAEVVAICQRTGVILGQVTLTDCRRADALASNVWAQAGAWHWILRDPVLFDEPIAAKGKLGLWDWEDAA